MYCGENNANFLKLLSDNVSPSVNTSMKYQIIMQCVDEFDSKLNSESQKTSNNYLWLYFGLTIGLIILNFVGNIGFASFTLSVAKNLHNKMLGTVIRTKMAFFDTTPQGRIMNRFSKDTNSVDQGIQRFAQSAVSTGLMIVGMVISMACVNWPCLIVIIPCIIIFIAIFMTFRLIYPQVKRLETVTRSPVFNIVQETIDCLVTVRAFRIQDSQSEAFRHAVDTNISLFFQMQGMTRWVYFRLGMVSSVFSLFIALVATLIAPSSPEIASYTGVIVSYGFSISNILMQFVITLVNLEGEMASTERLIEYHNLPQDGEFTNAEDKKLAKDWPKTDSGINVQHLNFRYRPELDLTLKDVSFKLNPKEHVGIVGRTGAGKSSITVAMYRLAEPEKGSQIIVDGVNILDLGLHSARKAFTIIP